MAMLIECSKCGAPLDVKQSSWIVTCAYCKSAQRVGKAKTTAQQTPPNWHAPPQWMPQQRAPGMQHQILRYDPKEAARKTVSLTALLGCLPFLIPVVIIAAQFGGPMISMFTWDGEETFVCDVNDNTTISGKKVKSKQKPLIVAEGNCKLTIEDSKLTGDEVFEQRGNGFITVVDSTITVTGRRGLKVEGNRGFRFVRSKLIIKPKSGSSTVVGIHTDSNGDIVFEDSTLEIAAGAAGAKVVVAQSTSNGSLRFEDSHIVVASKPKPGAVTLISATSNGSGSMEGGSVKASGLPLRVVSRRDVALDGTKLNGSKITQLDR